MAPRSKRRRKDAAAATLPDDVVLEILARVADNNDLVTLFRCAVACKPWRALVADRTFLRRRWPEGARHPSSFLGLFGRPWRCPRARMDGPPAFVPAPQSPLSPSRRFPGSFGPCTGGLLDNAASLASRQGLLLLRLRRGERRSGSLLAVCDMFAGTRDLLPRLDPSFCITGSAILTDADCCSSGRRRHSPLPSYSTFFNKVLILGHDTFSDSSAESVWRLPGKCVRLERIISINREGVVCRGKVHWLIWTSLSYYIFAFSIETGHTCLTKLPISRRQHEYIFYDSACLTVTVDGNLLLLCLRWNSIRLNFWTCRSAGEKLGSGRHGEAADWVRTRMVVLKPTKRTRPPDQSGLECMRVGEKSGTLFILGDRKLNYTVNIETGATEEVPSQFWDLRKLNIVPFEMDWTAFFMSRLDAKPRA